MKIRQKFFSIILTLCMAVNLLPFMSIVSLADDVKHTVTFDTLGRGTAPAPLTVNDGDNLWTVTDWEDIALGWVDGYQFYDWSLKEDGTMDDYYNYGSITEDITLYPIWVPAIDTVRLTIDEEFLPAAGKSVPEEIEVTLADGEENYSVSEAFWLCSSYDYDNRAAGTFEDNTTYYLFVEAVPDDNYLFKDINPIDNDNDLDTVTLNGEEAGHFEGHYELIRIIQKFTVGTPKTYRVNFNANGHGTAPTALNIDYGKTVMDATYGREDIIVPEDDGEWYFTGWYTNKNCTDGSEFNPDTPIYQNTTLYAKWIKKTVVDSVSLIFRAPKVGDSIGSMPLVSVDSANADYVIDGAEWYHDEDEVTEETFEAGKTYYVTIIVAANEGFVFKGGNERLSQSTPPLPLDEMVDFTVNGENANEYILNPYPVNMTGVRYPFTPRPDEEENEVITEVSATIEAPAVGSNTRYYPSVNQPVVSTEADANYIPAHTMWSTSDSMEAEPFEGTFVAGETYYAMVAFMPKNGYEFGEETSALINGEAQSSKKIFNGYFVVWVPFTVEKGINIPGVEVTIVAPVAGEVIGRIEAYVPEDANYTVDEESFWGVSSEDPEHPESITEATGVFEAGKEYQSLVLIRPNAGYYFDENVTGIVKGSDGTVCEVNYIDGADDNPYNGCVEVFGKFTVPEPGTAFTISFDENGGSGTMAPLTVAKDQTYIVPQNSFTPPKGKIFDHWEIDGTGSFDEGSEQTATADVTYKAIWEDDSLHTKTSVSIKNGVITGKTSLYNMPESFMVIIAGYKNDILTETVIRPLTNTARDTDFTLEHDADSVKIFVWSSIDNMTPVMTEPESVPVQVKNQTTQTEQSR